MLSVNSTDGAMNCQFPQVHKSGMMTWYVWVTNPIKCNDIMKEKYDLVKPFQHVIMNSDLYTVWNNIDGRVESTTSGPNPAFHHLYCKIKAT